MAIDQTGTKYEYHWLPCDLCGNVRTTTNEVSWVRTKGTWATETHDILVCKSCKASRTD